MAGTVAGQQIRGSGGGVDPALISMARGFWARARRYYRDGSGLLGFHTGALRDQGWIVWLRHDAVTGQWLEAGSTLTAEGAEAVTF